MSEKRKLKKELGVFSATSVVVGCVIGAGVFFKPYAIYQATGGAPGMGMLAWIVGGLASIFAALTFAEVAVLIPKTGGMVAYLGEVFERGSASWPDGCRSSSFIRHFWPAMVSRWAKN